MLLYVAVCAAFLHISYCGFESINGDCLADSSCSESLDLEKYSLQLKYGADPDPYRLVYMYDSDGTNIGRVGWESDKLYLHGCGDNEFDYLTNRTSTNATRTWTVTKNTTHIDVYVEDTLLASVEFAANNCSDTYGGDVVDAVSFVYFATVSGYWQEKPTKTLTGYNTSVVLNSQDTATISCQIDSNVELFSSKISWVITYSNGTTETKDINDDNVAFTQTSSTNTTKLTVDAPTVTTEYECLYDSAAANATAFIVIIEFTTSPTTNSIITNNMDTLTCTLPDTGYTVSVQWYKGDDITGSAGSDVSSTQQVSQAGDYKCEATFTASGSFAGGSVSSDVATISVIDFELEPSDVTVLLGQTSTLSCTVPNTAYSVKVNWYSSAGTMVKEDNGNHANTEYTSTYPVSESGDFYCKATYTSSDPFDGGDLQSSTATVTVIEYSVNPSDTDLGTGSSISLTCKLGEASYVGSWSWFKDGVEITDSTATIQANQENIIATKVSGEVDSAGEYYCKAVYEAQTGLSAGNIVSSTATVTIVDATVYDVVAEKGTTATLRCDISGAAQDPDSMKFTLDGTDVTATESLSDFSTVNGVKNMTVEIDNIQADANYTCVVEWSGSSYEFTLNVDMIDITAGELVYGVSGDTSTLTCVVEDSTSTPHSVYWNDGSSNIMAETDDYLPQQTTDGTTITSLLQVKSVSAAGEFTCIFVYQTDGVEQEISASTQLKVIYIEVASGGALQWEKGLSTPTCTLTNAQSQPDEVFWKYNSVNRTENVTLSSYSNGTQTTEIEFWGVDSDSNFFCYWAWGDMVIEQAVPIEVGELSVTGAVVEAGSTGSLTCNIKDFETPPTRVTWYKDGADTGISIEIGSDNTESSWYYTLSSAGDSDAAVYTCSLTVGNDVLNKSNEAVVVDVSITSPIMTKQGDDLTLTCQASLSNMQAAPTVYWTEGGSNMTEVAETTVTGSVVVSKVTLENVDINNELDYKCVFASTDPVSASITTDAVHPDILVFTSEPTSQYGAVGETASFTCGGEADNAAAGTPTVQWYNAAGETMILEAEVYTRDIPEGGYDVICKLVWNGTDLVLNKTVSAIVSNIDALDTQYTRVDNPSVSITCLYHATSELGEAPTTIIWYRKASDGSYIDLSEINGYTVDEGTYSDESQTTSLHITDVPLQYDKYEYQCTFFVGDQTIIHSTILRVLGIQLNIGTASTTVKSGTVLELESSPNRQDYSVDPTYTWYKEGEGGDVIQNGSEFTFTSIRVSDAATYIVAGHFDVTEGDLTKTIDVIQNITVYVTPSCKTGTILNIRNSGDIAAYVDDGWTADIVCNDDYLLDDRTYNTFQTATCESTDYVELNITNCTVSCILTVLDHDTDVTWHSQISDPGQFNLYLGDYFTTACQGDNNRTFPSGTNSTYTCIEGGDLLYEQCVDGCRYSSDNKIAVTFPANMSNAELVPINEEISYECLEGEDNVYNADHKYTCTAGIVNRSFIDLQICSATIPWDWIIISLCIVLLILAIIMIVVGAYLFFKRRSQRYYHREDGFIKRQKRKLKLLNTGDGIYSNPTAADEVELVELYQPIAIANYHSRYKQLMVDDCYAISVEYAKISKVVPSSMFPITIAKQPMYKSKNRFIDILPYDGTRVTLHQLENDPTSHYINASYIDTFDEARKFIAAQGPKPETVVDFWRMVWEQNSHVILMVTNLIEKGRRKCEDYYHDTKSQSYGNYTVECLGVVSFPDYKVRKFSVTQGSAKSRIITHYHYEGWPDHGVPDSPTSMVAFAKRAFSDNLPGPIIVHCSAGVGRTGTIISLHMQMENIRKNNKINIYDTVVQLRKCRKLMVQTESQYVFIYRAINEILRCGDTEVYAQMLSHAYRELRKIVPGSEKTGLQAEYQRLVYIAREDVTDRFTEATKQYNHNKNRYHNILPYEKNRVKLAYQTGVPGSDYINASWIASYHERNVFIATQAPKEGTVVDFWKMIYETGASSIVTMTNVVEDGKIRCVQYWPVHEHEVLDYGGCRIKLLAVEESAEVTRREVCLTHSGDGHTAVRLLRMWHFTSLSEKSMRMEGLKMISIIENMSRWQKQQGNAPAVVHCGGGVGRAAAFIAISNCLEQLKLEGTVDVFQTVLQLRRARPFMVQSVDQYDYIYKALVQYVESFDTYENFK